MNESIETLETQVHDQQSLIDQLRVAEKERLREGRRLQRAHDALVSNSWGGLPLRRAHSFDLGKPTAESTYEDELSNLQLSNRKLKQELATREQRENELESELAVLVRENKTLENQNRELQVKARMIEIKRDYRSLDNLNEAVCKYCDSVIKFDDGGRVDEQGADIRRHSSLDLVPIAEELCPQRKCPLPNHSMVHSKSDGVSLLGEIDAEYHNLMDKYNTLLTRSRSASFHESGGRTRTSSFRRRADAGSQEHGDASPTKASILNSLGSSPSSPSMLTNQELSPCPVDSHFETSPPEYKALFKRIYDVLHRPLKKTKPTSDDS